MKYMEIIKEYGCQNNINIYLVGGAVRDKFLKRTVSDYDFVLEGDSHRAAQSLAEALKGTYVNMHTEVARVAAEERIFDFSRLKGRDIHEDLRKRDFTVNSIAVDIKSGSIIDANDGLGDIENKVIRAVYPMAFDDDPVRMIRAVRLAGKLGFNIDNATQKLIMKKASLIRETAGERILEELLKIFECEKSHVYIEMLEDLNLFENIFSSLKDLGLKRDFTTSLRYLEENIKGLYETRWGTRVREHLNKSLNGRERMACLKLGHLLGSILNGHMENTFSDGNRLEESLYDMECRLGEIYSRLVLSNDQRGMINDLVLGYDSAVRLVKEGIREEELFGFFTKLKDNTIDVLISTLYTLLSEQGTGNIAYKYNDSVLHMIDRYYTSRELHGKLVSGRDIMNMTTLRGREIGEALEKINEQIFYGNIKTREEALSFLKQLAGRD